MWVTRSIIKKVKSIIIRSNTTKVFLPNYTKGVPWRNSNCITAITQMNPKDNVLSAEIITRKNNDNDFDVSISTTQYGETVTLTGGDLGPVITLEDIDYVEVYFTVKEVFRLRSVGVSPPARRYLFKLNGDIIGAITTPQDAQPDNEVAIVASPYSSTIMTRDKYIDNMSMTYNFANWDFSNQGVPLYGVFSQCMMCFIGYRKYFSLSQELYIYIQGCEVTGSGAITKVVYRTRKGIPSKNEEGVAIFYEQN